MGRGAARAGGKQTPSTVVLRVAVPLLVIGGCADQLCLQPAQRDSAGIRIVEHGADVLAAAPLQSLREAELRIGALESLPAYEFARIGAIAPLSGDRLAVADADNNEVRFFDDTGAHEKSVGRTGSGPGEFLNLFQVWRARGDSVLAYDAGLDRFTMISETGGNVRTFHLEPTDDLRYLPLSVFNDGAILGLTATTLGGISGNGVWVDSSQLMLHDAAGRFLDTIARTRFMQRWSRSSGDRNLVLSLPLTVNGQYAVAGQRVCVADRDVFEVRCHARDGKLVLIMRASPPERPVTQAIIDSFLVARTRLPLGEARKSVWLQLPYPKKLPPYMGLRGDSAGHIWLARYHAPGDTLIEWLHFDQDGRLRTRLRVPASFRLLDVDLSRVYGIDQDSLGVEYVTRHTLAPAAKRCRG